MVFRRDPALPDTRQQELAATGVGILRRYRHPEDWIEGYGISSALRHCLALAVAELRAVPGSPTLPMAQMYGSGILAWAKMAGLQAHHLQLHRREDGSVYLAVPKLYWKTVLSRLRDIGAPKR